MTNRVRRWRFAAVNVRAAWRCRSYDPDLARYYLRTARLNARLR